MGPCYVGSLLPMPIPLLKRKGGNFTKRYRNINCIEKIVLNF